MENLSLIVAVGQNNEIGKGNTLLWYLPNDLKFFKEKTLNKTIIMGRKTFESLPGLLPKRKHLVLTNNKELMLENVTILNNTDDALLYIENSKDEIFVIGGSSIYEIFLPYANVLYITKVEDTKEADSYFPVIDENNYYISLVGENEDNNIKYKHYKYVKKAFK